MASPDESTQTMGVNYAEVSHEGRRLTAYAIHCGYVEEKINGPIITTLWHEGGPLYHVRQHNHETHTRVFWESFETLTEARKLLDKQPGVCYPTRQREAACA